MGQGELMLGFIDTYLYDPIRLIWGQGYSLELKVFLIAAFCIFILSLVFIFLRGLFYFAVFLPNLLTRFFRLFNSFGNSPRHSFYLLTYPANSTKSAYATEQLQRVLAEIVTPKSRWFRFISSSLSYSLELVASKDAGISYRVRLPQEYSLAFKRALMSYLPDLLIEETVDYLSTLNKKRGVVWELNLSGDYLLPLQPNQSLTEHDPLAYLSGQMRNLQSGELIAYQLVCRPLNRYSHAIVWRRVKDFRRRLALKKQLAPKLRTNRQRISQALLWLILWPIYSLVVLTRFTTIFTTNDIPKSWQSTKDTSPVSPYEAEVEALIKTKLAEPLSVLSCRFLVVSQTQDKARLESLSAALAGFNSPLQSLSIRRGRSFKSFVARRSSFAFLNQPFLVSSSELAGLYHFPSSSTGQTEGLVKSRSPVLASPLSQKDPSLFDLKLGHNPYDNRLEPIGLRRSQRLRHTYVIGKTGMGKSTLLLSSIVEDMEAGRGLAVLDPHGDSFREILGLIPASRLGDVVIFDPSDRAYPLGLNIFDPKVDFASQSERDEWITSAVLSIFAKLADENQWGPRMEHILRSATLSALQTERPNLFTLQRLLTDKTYQREVAKDLRDPVLKQFWEKEFKLMGSMQLAAATAPLTHRLGHFITAKLSRSILLQTETSLNISDIMNSGKILLVNLAKGSIGEDQSRFFGTILTSLIWMGAYQRARIKESERRDFYVYVDEFQNFATKQFADIFSEGRKFHLGLTVSHQSIAQIKDKDLIKVVSGNAGTIISFRLSPEDETFILPYMKPEVGKGDIVNLPPYSFYIKVTSDKAEEAFSGRTLLLHRKSRDKVVRDALRISREKYARTLSEVEIEINKLIEDTGPKKTAVKRYRVKRDMMGI